MEKYITIPENLNEYIGKVKEKTFHTICEYINQNYNVTSAWGDGGKKWDYEYKFRKGSKTLCTFYFIKDYLGLMIIFGGEERKKVEEIRNCLSQEILTMYDEAQTYHDGNGLCLN